MSNSLPIEEVSTKYLKEYTDYVTKSRVLPTLCLKNVHKRILWSLIKLGAGDGKGRFIKTSTVSGKALGYHPHGSASIDGAISTLVNSPNSLVAGEDLGPITWEILQLPLGIQRSEHQNYLNLFWMIP